MTLPTHVCFGSFSWILVLLFLGLPLNPLYIVVACFASLLPDLDYPSSTIARALPFISERLERRFGHRTLTHSLLGWLVFGFLSLPLFLWNKKIWAAGLVGYFSHILLDCMNKSGVALFYPDGIQAVLPGREELRFVHAGKGEVVLFFILLGLNLVTFPVAQTGLIKSLHYLRADSESAVADFRDWAKEYKVFCDLKGIDAITNKAVMGEFEVVGVEGATTLIISNRGHLRSVGTKDDVNIRVVRARVKKREKINTVVSEVDLKGRLLQDLGFYFDKEKEHFLFGVLDVAARVPLEERPDRFSTLSYVNNKLVFNYTTYDELIQQGLEGLEVKEGVVLIKTILKPGESMQVMEQKKERKKRRFVKVSLRLEELDEVLVRRGDELKISQPLARMAKKDRQELAKLKEELAYQEELFVEGVGSLKSKNEVLAKLEKIQADYQRDKLSKFKGEVASVKVGGVRDGLVDVEVGILLEEVLGM